MDNVSITTTVNENQAARILISGSLVIRDAVEIKEELLQLMSNHTDMDIYFKNIERIDITALQMLMALSRSAAEQAKNVKYNFESTEYINTVLSSSGFDKFITI